MPLLSFQSYHDMPEAERLRRIGELIATAVIRYERDQRKQRSAARVSRNVPGNEKAVVVNDRVERAMLGYLSQVGAATPRDFRIALGVSPMTITRRLAHLRAVGLVLATGETRAAVYRLAGDVGRN